jgi:hypothetical protein
MLADIKINMIKKTVIIIILFVLVITFSFYKEIDIICFKIKLSKLKSVSISEIYQVEEKNEKIIDNPDIINKFKQILSDVSYTNKPMMSSLSKYKIILLDDTKKQIAEIYCIPKILIKGFNNNLTLENEKYNELYNLINFIESET